VTLGPDRRHRQQGVAPVERPDRRLFIHAEHRRVRGRIQIKPDDVGRLGLEVRIGRAHVAFEPMGFSPARCQAFAINV
jgi:hypothetical protein